MGWRECSGPPGVDGSFVLVRHIPLSSFLPVISWLTEFGVRRVFQGVSSIVVAVIFLRDGTLILPWRGPRFLVTPVILIKSFRQGINGELGHPP